MAILADAESIVGRLKSKTHTSLSGEYLMSEFVSLTCPSCGAKLQIGNDLEKFACVHCGNEHVVKRGGGIITIVPVLEHFKKVSVGIDKTASELAIQRLKEECENLRGGWWEFIISDVMKESTSLIDMMTGKWKPYGRWFYNTISTFPNFKINGNKVKQTLDTREISEIIWNMSSQEIQQVIDYLPSRWKGKDLEEIIKFGEKILNYAKKVEECRSELKKHKSIVQA